VSSIAYRDIIFKQFFFFYDKILSGDIYAEI